MNNKKYILTNKDIEDVSNILNFYQSHSTNLKEITNFTLRKMGAHRENEYTLYLNTACIHNNYNFVVCEADFTTKEERTKYANELAKKFIEKGYVIEIEEEKYNCCPTHCCLNCGCCYGYIECPVVTGKSKGFLCEMCEENNEDWYVEELEKEVINLKIKAITLEYYLQQICDDASADLDHPNKRIWAIRSSLHREIINAINYEYNSERAIKTQECNKAGVNPEADKEKNRCIELHKIMKGEK